jgi:hypothetical protein
MIPFRRSFTKCPQEIIDFLTSSELLEFICVCRSSFTTELGKRKAIHADYIINYFYSKQHTYSQYNISICLYKVYDKFYMQNVRHLFYLLPEMFAFIEKKQIKVLHLSCAAMIWDSKYDSSRLHSISDYLTHPFNWELHGVIQPYLVPLLDFIRISSLVECNIGLFRDVIHKNTLCNIITTSGTLKHLSVRRFVPVDIDSDPKVSLYKLPDGKVIWSSHDPMDVYSYE